MKKIRNGAILRVQKRVILSTTVVVCGVLWLGLPAGAFAQLSPGDLSRAHTDLEGLRNCKKCHDLGDRQVQDKCLACHAEIRSQRIEAKGLHARPEFATCVDCHVEHNGRDYELVRWEGGRERFNHDRTGYHLEGKHAGLDCAKCHNPANITDPDRWRGMGKNLSSTFLGLDTACLACHEDRHQGQLDLDCLKCHTMDGWKPQPKFDHAAADFPLTGMHAKVDCARCHKPEAIRAGLQATARYKPVTHAACTDCHQDPHKSRLGNDCTRCHTTAGWRQVRDNDFDHDKTRYPLRGRHATVACEKCHAQENRRDGALSMPAFAACTDCHRDEHDGRGRKRPGWLACDTCHDVQGFRPARYTLEQHDRSAYPLDGGHLAVPCGMCHRVQQAADKARAARLDLAPAHAGCRDCHRDPHTPAEPRESGLLADMACAVCHTPASWRKLNPEGGFDHGKTRFALDGRHAQVACDRCHQPDPEHPGRLPFTGAPTDCNACHQDVHGGQFAARVLPSGGLIDCAHCHVTRDWLAEKFDHDKDARFALRGGHEHTPCAGCHKPMDDTEGAIVRYRPLPTECRACHDIQPAEGSTGP